MRAANDLSYEGYYGMDGEPLSWGEALKLYEDGFNDTRRVAYTERFDVTISTVLLVIDHSFGRGAPVIFETMIFTRDAPWWAYLWFGLRGINIRDLDQYQDRYCSKAQALRGHARACALAFGKGE